ARFADVDVKAASQKQIRARQMPAVGGEVQERPFVGLVADVQLLGVLVEQRGQGGGVAGCAAWKSWPSRVNESTCALSARQLANPYCLASANCASASLAPGWAARSSARRRLACLRSQSRSGFSGRGGSDIGTPSLPVRGRRPFHAARRPQLGRGIEGHVRNGRGGVNPFRRPSAPPPGPCRSR